MASRFVRPDTDTLIISRGDTLTVRRRLSAGERRAMFARLSQTAPNGDLKANPLQTGLAVVTAYLLDWTLADEEGKPVQIRGLSPDNLAVVLDSLHPADFEEIQKAVEAHRKAMDEERSAEKNAPSGATASPPTSPSLDSSAGATTGSPSSTTTSMAS